MSLARKIAWWSLLAMVFVVPVAMSNATWLSRIGFPATLPFTYDQFDIMKVFFQRVLTLVALGAWSWDILTKGGKIRRTPVDWLILAFLAWVTITTITSIHPATAFFGKYRRFEGLLSFINYAVIYFLVLQFADRPSRVKTLAQSLFWSSIVVAGYGVLQRVGLDPVQWGQLPFEQFRPFSTYGNPDLLGGFLMFSLPIALGLALAEEKLWMRLVYWVGFGINVFVLDRGVHPRRVDRRRLRHRGDDRDRLAPLGQAGLDRLAGRRSDRRVRRLGDRSQPVQPQRRHELRQALRVDLRSSTRAADKTRTEIWQAAIVGRQGAADLRVRRRHLPARLPQVQADRVRRGRRLPLGGRQRAQLPAAARGGHRHPRRADDVRRLRMGGGPLVRDRLQQDRRHEAHPGRRVLGRFARATCSS